MTITNEHYGLSVDPGRGGGVSSLTRDGRELIAAGQVGNELAVYEEYSSHPTAGEGPWHLLPKGPVVGSASTAAHVRAYRSPLGERLEIRGRIGTTLRYTQTITLWHGVARVDCRTTIDEFTGEDKLLRLRWPCPVLGAMPVSEVGDAVVGRGYGLVNDPDGSGRSVDTALHPWTLENPAYTWFGLSSAARVRVSGLNSHGADDSAVRAISVAEVVSPAESESAPLARELMVALVRTGVTATCSDGAGSRYGHLDVDSNLPDARIALGGPDRNEFTAAVLAAADPTYAAELGRQLKSGGRARVWVPAATPLAQAWVPDADLRGTLALPVLVIAGSDDAALTAEIAAVVADLVDAEIAVTQEAAASIGPFEAHTVAVANRGVPSFAVDSHGTLHTSLMRSCTGWPSGVWTDHPRRTAPDGSNFQLQHWTHTFDYALLAGPGDWRDAEIPARSAEFSRPLYAVAPADPVGGLPASGSLLGVRSAGTVALAALKAAGNPLAAGSGEPVTPDVVAIRLLETHGRATAVEVDSPLGTLTGLESVDLLENPGPQTGSSDAGLTMHGYQVSTVQARFDVTQLLDAGATVLAPAAEAAQPLYARYWLHNRGPAPLGGLPAVAYLDPHAVDAAPGAQVLLRLTAASDRTDAALAGVVRLLCPSGWAAEPAELTFDLAAGEHAEADVAVSIPPGADPGLYPVRAQLELTGDVPAEWRQVVEDVCVVSVGASADDLLYLIATPLDVELTVGHTARLITTVGTDARTELALEAHLISPWGTWDWLGPDAVGALLPAGGTVDVSFDVTPPPWLAPGEWWALMRITCAGRLVYTPAVRINVLPGQSRDGSADAGDGAGNAEVIGVD